MTFILNVLHKDFSLLASGAIFHYSTTKRGLSAEQIPVLIARDRHGEMTDEVLKDLSEVSITKVLKPVLAQDVVLCTDGNQSYRSFADTENIAHVRLIASNESRVINKVYHTKIEMPGITIHTKKGVTINGFE